MSVQDGQKVDAAVTNAAFISRTSNSNTIGKVDLENTDNDSLTDVQRVVSEAVDAIGLANKSSTDPNANTYSSSTTGVDGNDRKAAIGILDALFNGTTGHSHDGTDGQGPQISASNLGDFNNLFGEFGEYTFDAASGTSINVSALFAAQTSGGDANTAGVVTSAPDNYVSILEKETGGEIEDPSGNRVFARLTETAGVWTLSFFVNLAGTETSYNLPSEDIRFLYREVFTAADRPTLGANVGIYDTQSAIGDIPDASPTQRGAVNTSAQSFAGVKEFNSRPTTGGVDLVDISASQVITNKDIDGGSASDTSRLTLPKGTKAALDALTRKEGTIVYATDEAKPFFDDGSALQEIGAGSDAETSLEIYAQQDFEEFTTVLSSGNNASFLGGGVLSGSFSLETTTPINGTQSGLYTAGASSNNDYIELEAIDLALKERGAQSRIRVWNDSSSFSTDITLVVYDKTNASSLATLVIPGSSSRSFYDLTFTTLTSTAQISYGFHYLDNPLNTESHVFDDFSFTTDFSSGSVVAPSTSTQFLTSNITTNTTVTDLTLSCTIGEEYMVQLHYVLSTSTGGTPRIRIVHDGSDLNTAFIQGQSGNLNTVKATITRRFVATANQVTFVTENIAAGRSLNGNNSTQNTFVELTEF